MQRTATLIVLVGLAATLACAQDPAPTPAPAAGQPAEYAAGMKAMNARKWKEALDDFDKVHDASDDYMAQALYWKAYNLGKLDRTSDALATCKQLGTKYPQSQWTEECADLSANRKVFVRFRDDRDARDIHKVQAQVSEARAQFVKQYADSARQYAQDYAFMVDIDPQVHPDVHVNFGGKIDPNDEIKLIALNSLMQQEPDKAMPVLRSFLNSDKPVEVKRRAMFVIEQSKSPEAQKLLVDMANSNKEPELQRAAVWAIASNPKEHTAELLAIYKSSSDQEVKRAAATGLMSARDAKDLIAIARTETDPEMKRTVVQYLSDMQDPEALAYMEELLK